jgi:hypothetical protein
MFERYSEKARRTVFFARYEASVFGSPYIEIEHLLLGLLREDRTLRNKLPSGAGEKIRKRIEEFAPAPGQRISTSVDLPLSKDSKRALTCAAEESAALGHPSIDCCHLLLGILRIETSTAAAVLREFGIEYASYRTEAAELTAVPPPPPLPKLERPENIPLRKAAVDLDLLLANATHFQEDTGAQRLKRAGWTRKEAVGHLIDWAAAHQQWLARALTEPKLTAAGYPEDGWLSAQQYNDLRWQDLVDLCVSLNRLILHVIERVPQEKIDTPCRIGIAEPIPLRELVSRYVEHCEDIMGQLLMRK